MINYNALSRICIWISRIGCCRGFGIQSPWAYSFVRYVINEHYPYYAYGMLRAAFSRLSVIERKMGELYFRLVNFLQPSRVLFLFPTDDRLTGLRRRYIRSGCGRCEFAEIEKHDGSLSEDTSRPILDTSHPVLVCCDSSLVSADMIMSMVGRLRKGDMILIEDIKANKDSRMMWRDLRNILSGALMFDLFYCGIVYVDADRYMQHFKINF